MLPPKDQITICFAHVAYRFDQRFPPRNTGIKAIHVRSREEMDKVIGDCDVLVCSGLWRNDLPKIAPKLKFVQSISAGVNQYDQAIMKASGVRLASAQGANARAVSDHAMALILSLARRLPEARDNQHRKHWRGMIGDLTTREDELAGKTLLVVGVGRIGGRLARLAKAFEMNVIGIRRDPANGAEGADEIHGFDRLHDLIPKADVVALTCALTPETTGIIGAKALSLLKPSAWLVNVARGPVVDEPALIAALRANAFAGAALDVTAEEPLPEGSPLWDLPNVFITPHTGGETRSYEDSVIDLLVENVDRLTSGQAALKNQIV